MRRIVLVGVLLVLAACSGSPAVEDSGEFEAVEQEQEGVDVAAQTDTGVTVGVFGENARALFVGPMQERASFDVTRGSDGADMLLVQPYFEYINVEPGASFGLGLDEGEWLNTNQYEPVEEITENTSYYIPAPFLPAGGAEEGDAYALPVALNVNAMAENPEGMTQTLDAFSFPMPGIDPEFSGEPVLPLPDIEAVTTAAREASQQPEPWNEWVVPVVTPDDTIMFAPAWLQENGIVVLYPPELPGQFFYPGEIAFPGEMIAPGKEFFPGEMIISTRTLGLEPGSSTDDVEPSDIFIAVVGSGEGAVFRVVDDFMID